MKITCVGSGAFGVAMATLLSKSTKNQVSLWTHDPKWMEKNEIESVFISTDLENLVEHADIVFLLVSTLFLEETIVRLKKMSLKRKIIFLGSKGMLEKSPYFYTNLLKKEVKAKYIGFFSGPNLANDFMKDTFCSMTFSFKSRSIKKVVQTIFPDYVLLHFIKNPNVLELASTLKNIYAIGAGIMEEETHSNSAVHTYLAFCYHELLDLLNQIFVIDTFPLDITGDFYLTGTMKESRNRNYGISFVKGKGEQYLKKHTVEGHNNLSCVIAYLKKNRIKAPIIFDLYKILFFHEPITKLKETMMK